MLKKKKALHCNEQYLQLQQQVQLMYFEGLFEMHKCSS